MDPANAVGEKPFEQSDSLFEVSGMKRMVPDEKTDGIIVKARRASRWDCGPKQSDRNFSLGSHRDHALGTHPDSTKVTVVRLDPSDRSPPNGQVDSSEYPNLVDCTKSSRKKGAPYQQKSDDHGGHATDSLFQSSEMGNSSSFGWTRGFKGRIPSDRDHAVGRETYDHHNNRGNGLSMSSCSGRKNDSSRHNSSRRYTDRDGGSSSAYRSDRRNFRNDTGPVGQRRRDGWSSRRRSESRFYHSSNHLEKESRQVRSHLSVANRVNEHRENTTVQTCYAAEDFAPQLYKSRTPSRAPFMGFENTEMTHSLHTTAEEEYRDRRSEKGGWVYLDNSGNWQGPMELAALKTLNETGELKSDHMVKQQMSNEWVTLENAKSPIDQTQMQGPLGSIPHNQTQVLIGESCSQIFGAHDGATTAVEHYSAGAATCFAAGEEFQLVDINGCSRDHLQKETVVERDSDNLVDFRIDERVDRLMQGFTLIPGRENEIVSEALSTARQMQGGDETLFHNEDISPRSHVGFSPFGNPWKEGDFCGDAQSFQGLGFDVNALGGHVPSVMPPVLEGQEIGADSLTCSQEQQKECSKWTLQGGDWKLIYPTDGLPQGHSDSNIVHEKCIGKKVVLNDGQPLCTIKQSGLPDPRKQHQESSSANDFSALRMVDLPPWVTAMSGQKRESMERLERPSEVQQKQAHSFQQQKDPTSRAHSVGVGHQGLSRPEGSPHPAILRSKLSHTSNTALVSSLNTPMEPRHPTRKLLRGAVGKGAIPHAIPCNERLSGLKKETIEANDCASVSKFPVQSSFVGVLTSNRNCMVQYATEPCTSVPQRVQSNLVESFDGKPAAGMPILDLQTDIGIPSVGDPLVSQSGSFMGRCDIDFGECEWFYLDGSGVEIGPFFLGQLQAKIGGGTLVEGMSVFRKSDRFWIPLFLPKVAVQKAEASQTSAANFQEQHDCSSPGPPGVSRELPFDSDSGVNNLSNIAHSSVLNILDGACDVRKLHPSFMGFTCGRLHEFVMRHYKNHLLPGTLNECLEAWLHGKRVGENANLLISSSAVGQPAPLLDTCSGKALDSENLESYPASSKTSRYIQSSTSSFGSLPNSKFVEENISKAFSTNSHMGTTKRKVEAAVESDDEKVKSRRFGKKRRSLHLQDSGIDSGPETSTFLESHSADQFMSLGEAKGYGTMNQQESSWGYLPESILRQIYHCFQGDWKTFACAASTCKSWRRTAESFRKEIKSADFSSLGVSCTDAAICSLAEFGGNFTKVCLGSCLRVSPIALKHLLHACPSINSVDITGCEQFEELRKSFPRIDWLSPFERRTTSVELGSSGGGDEHSKLKSVNLVGEKRGVTSKASDVLITGFSSKRAKLEFSENTTPEPMDLDSVDMTDQGSQSLSTNDSCRDAKSLSNGNFVKVGPEVAKSKAVQPKNGSRFNNKAKPESRSLKNIVKVEEKRRMKGSQLWSGDKCMPPKLKGEVLKKNGVASPGEGEHFPGEGERLVEAFASILKALMDIDGQKFFFRMGASDDKGSTVNGQMDFLTMEKKLKKGYYCGDWHGLRAFKDDLSTLCHCALHFNAKISSMSNEQSSPSTIKTKKTLAEAAKEIYLTAYRMMGSLGNSLAQSSPPENQAQDKVPNAILSAKSRGKTRGFGSSNPGLKGRRHYVNGDKGRTGPLIKKSKLISTYSDGELEFRFAEHDVRRFTERSNIWSDSDTEISDADVPEDDGEDSDGSNGSDSDGDDSLQEEESDSMYDVGSWKIEAREWGARMTKLSMVPPVTRKYEVIEDYTVVIDQSTVDRKMTVEMPDDYANKLQVARKNGDSEYSHLDFPEIKDHKPRKRLGEEVVEQEVYGIDPYTYNLLMDTMPKDTLDFNETQRHQFIEEGLLRTLNKEVSHFTGTGKAPMEFPLKPVVEKMRDDAKGANKRSLQDFCYHILNNIERRPKDRYTAYRKGLGVVCNSKDGFQKDDFVVEFLGEVYPAWRWYEKQDAIRSLQKKERDSAPEFYNIMLERPKGGAGGYDLVVVDAMHKANYASRICHSCRPNCEAKVTAVNGRYTIGVYTLRPILYGEELTFDYNSVTESKEEWEVSICLCGTHGCRGSYLNLTGAGTFEEIMKRYHGLLDRHHLLLEACAGDITKHEWDEMRQAGVGSCMLSGLPIWAIKYTARLVGFIKLERAHLPEELMKASKKRKRDFSSDAFSESERLDAEVQAEGVYNNRLQNLAITLDKVRYLLTKLFKDPCKAPPPLRKLEPKELVHLIWKGEGSVVGELLHCMARHVSKEEFLAFEQKVLKHDPDESQDVENNLRQSLFWLRDELRNLEATCLCRHDAAADIIHLYACTEYFFTSQEYDTCQSPAISLNSLDLGPRHVCGSGTGVISRRKLYGKDYVLGQLIFWFQHSIADPGASLAKARRGCLVLPDVSSCYSKSLQQDFRRGYGPRQRFEMITHMEQRPQKQWPKADIWDFKSSRGLFGSPMLDAIRAGDQLDPEMLKWLRTRPSVFQGPWDDSER